MSDSQPASKPTENREPDSAVCLKCGVPMMLTHQNEPGGHKSPVWWCLFCGRGFYANSNIVQVVRVSKP